MRRSDAFSLVEVTIAIGIVAVGLLGIFALIPIGLSSGAEAIDATRTALIAGDVTARVRTAVSASTFAGANDVSIQSFYDRDGVPMAGPANASYRADATVHKDWGTNGPPTNVDSTVLRPVTVDIRWPLNPSTGAPLGNNRSSFSFLIRRP